MADYSRRTVGLVREILSEKAQVFAQTTSWIVAYWKPKLFDIGLQIDVINVMSSHSFYWTNIIPALLERKLENNYGYGPLLSSIDQDDAVHKLVKFLLNSLPPQSAAGASYANRSLPTVSYFQLVLQRIRRFRKSLASCPMLTRCVPRCLNS